MASGATDVLDAARIVERFEDALEGVTVVCATAMTPRDFGPPTRAPRGCFDAYAAGSERLAFVFGSERFGLGNDEVYASHVCLSIPTAPDYGSLNLSQAVQLLAYDWRMAQGGFPVVARTKPVRSADARAVHGLREHWRGMLEQIGFLDPQVPRKLMARLHQLVNRAQVTEEEVHILRGVARQVRKVQQGQVAQTQAQAPRAEPPARDGA